MKKIEEKETLKSYYKKTLLNNHYETLLSTRTIILRKFKIEFLLFANFLERLRGIGQSETVTDLNAQLTIDISLPL